MVLVSEWRSHKPYLSAETTDRCRRRAGVRDCLPEKSMARPVAPNTRAPLPRPESTEPGGRSRLLASANRRTFFAARRQRLDSGITAKVLDLHLHVTQHDRP